MDKEAQLKKINTELKVYINEASFVSTSCRNRLIRLLGKTFDISLPVENFARIDVLLLEDGSIEMRDEVYRREEVLSFDDVIARYQGFKEKADAMLRRRGSDTFSGNEARNILNLFMVLLIMVLFIALIGYTIDAFLDGNYIHCIWLIMIVSSWFIPSVRDRFIQVFLYLKRKFKR